MTTTKTDLTGLELRWLIRRDAPDVIRIAKRTGGELHTESRLTNALRRRNCIGRVAEYSGRFVIGYEIYVLVDNVIDVEEMAIDQPFRRNGIGTAFLDSLKGKLSDHRRRVIQVTVRDSALDAQLFLRENYFRAVSWSRRHYDNGEDGIVFRYVKTCWD